MTADLAAASTTTSAGSPRWVPGLARSDPRLCCYRLKSRWSWSPTSRTARPPVGHTETVHGATTDLTTGVGRQRDGASPPTARRPPCECCSPSRSPARPP